ncbi:gamma-glutamyltransferase [Rubrivirga sp. IMCC43871]|uniref:gamma-glutamyltransferase n=1 Tax=Rubrivirga sp. IMCC43871 TaxID=3391575 RepID=UPI00398FB448
MKSAKRFLVWTFTVLFVVVIAAAAAGLSFRSALGPPVEASPPRAVYAPHGVVASSQPLASQAGLAVLQRGGNAVDAAVTTAAVLSVVEPYMTGVGGDLFAMLWSAEEGRLVGLNASGRSGSLMTREALAHLGTVPSDGAETVTVPGALSGWAALLEQHGTITLAEALAPAIALAEDGFPVSDVTAAEWAIFTGLLKKDPGASATFLVDGERAPAVGEWFSNPDFAATLRTIAREGPEVLYGGDLGERIATHVEGLGGFLTPDDFGRHTAEWVEPLSVPYKEYRLWELPPNGQGIAALEMLRILEPVDLAAMGHNSAAYLHHLIEAKKLAYADLEHFVGDPEHMAATPEQLLADGFITQRRALIDPDRALPRADPDTSLTTSETTYLTVADAEGNMISFIQSLAGGFGSGVVVPGTGFALQNRGVGLSYEEGRANTVAPGRRPFHTIIPGFVTRAGADGEQEPWLSYGIVGGPQQPQAHVQVLLNIVLFGMDVQQALDAPRFRHWRKNRVSFESSIPEEVVDDLRSMGHEPQNPLGATAQTIFLGTNRGLVFGGGQAVMRNSRGYVAGSDSRRDGVAAAH